MTARAANCPNCGGPLEFKNAATVYVVCPHCGGASQRTDVDLEYLGVAATVTPIDSPLDLGARGDYQGLGWTIVGQLQLDHGQGPWNEWCACFDDGSWRWIAEAQGKVYCTRALDVDALRLPRHIRLQPGLLVDLGESGQFTVAEVGEGTVVAARGELPVRVRVGSTVRYADCSGPEDRFATLDYESGPTCVAAYAGQRLEFAALGFHPESVARREAPRVTADRLGCAACGAPARRFDTEAARVVCGACGAMYDPRTQHVLAKKFAPTRPQPLVELGTEIELRERRYRVIAFLVRAVTVAGRRYPWTEYLLRAEDGAYRWLVHQNGHWNFVEPVELGAVTRSAGVATWRGIRFRHFQGGNAVVEHVLGEVYWAVERGETVNAQDYVAPPLMLGFEQSGRRGTGEIVASVCHYLPHAEAQRAFKLATLSKPRGIAPNQPNPWRAGPWLAPCLALLAAVGLLMAGFHASFARRPASRLAGVLLPGVPPAEPEVWFSDEFELRPRVGNVQVTLTSQGGSGNYWIGFNGALANTQTGDIHAFAVAGERWQGVTDGEHWSEGSGGETVYLGSVPAGTYALRLERMREPIASAGVTWQVAAVSQVPSVVRPLLLLVLLSIPLVVVFARRASFEHRRWQESDHA